MRVSVFGLGYVGCVTAACLAKAGHVVVGVDVNAEKVAMINSATSPIVEPGLPELLREVVGTGRLRATTSSEQAVAESDLSLICVGTPSRTNGRIDVDAVVRTGQSIGQAVRKHAEPHTVVLRSTVLPGTAEQYLVPALLAGAGGRAATRVAVNPEFMREGSSLNDFSRPPLTLVGCGDPATASLLRLLYESVQAPFVHTSIRTAEMVKYAANAFHALKVCFANEVADVCAALGADGAEVMRVFAMDRKLNVSEAYLRPGFAFGGSCLPKDLRALLYAARAADVSVPMLASVLPSNEAQVRRGVDLVLASRRQRVGVVGLSFKAGTDDLRESPMVALVETLIGKGCDVRILDRNVSMARLVGANRRYIEEEIPHIASLMCASAEALLAHADVIVIGNACEDATEVLAAAQPEHLTVDLTRGQAARSASRSSAGS
jgi:GDP-mannose 6-dehydrogenase